MLGYALAAPATVAPTGGRLVLALAASPGCSSHHLHALTHHGRDARPAKIPFHAPRAICLRAAEAAASAAATQDHLRFGHSPRPSRLDITAARRHIEHSDGARLRDPTSLPTRTITHLPSLFQPPGHTPFRPSLARRRNRCASSCARFSPPPASLVRAGGPFACVPAVMDRGPSSGWCREGDGHLHRRHVRTRVVRKRP